jgi:hypothetical protein
MAPKFSKVELLTKNNGNNNCSITKIEFEDCGLMITGDYFIVILDEIDAINNIKTSTGRIYHMSEISAYKTFAQ